MITSWGPDPWAGWGRSTFWAPGLDLGIPKVDRSYPTSKVRGNGQEEQPHLQGEAAAGRRRGERSYSMFKVRRGSHEKIPLIQSKEQQLEFAGAAMKRYRMSR